MMTTPPNFQKQSSEGALLKKVFLKISENSQKNRSGSSHQRRSEKKMFLEISQNSQENTCARVSFLIKLQALQRLWHRCFPVNFAKFLRTPFVYRTSPVAASAEAKRGIEEKRVEIG